MVRLDLDEELLSFEAAVSERFPYVASKLPGGFSKCSALDVSCHHPVTPKEQWLSLAIVLVGLLAFDNFVLSRLQGFKAHACIVVFWVAVTALYLFLYTSITSPEEGSVWVFGYLLEIMLSFDNVFVYHLIICRFKVPYAQQHKVLFIAIFGTLIARLGLFYVFGSLVGAFHWLRIIFGIILIHSAIKATLGDDEGDPCDIWMVRAINWLFNLRTLDAYDPQGRMFVHKDGQMFATLLLPAVVCVEATDIVFAVDSLFAKVATIPDVWVSFSSSAFAVLVLRSAVFVLRDIMDVFDHLKYGLCLILVLVGVDLIAEDIYHISMRVLSCLLVAIFLGSMVTSMWAKCMPSRLEANEVYDDTSLIQSKRSKKTAKGHADQENAVPALQTIPEGDEETQSDGKEISSSDGPSRQSGTDSDGDVMDVEVDAMGSILPMRRFSSSASTEAAGPLASPIADLDQSAAQPDAVVTVGSPRSDQASARTAATETLISPRSDQASSSPKTDCHYIGDDDNNYFEDTREDTAASSVAGSPFSSLMGSAPSATDGQLDAAPTAEPPSLVPSTLLPAAPSQHTKRPEAAAAPSSVVPPLNLSLATNY
eukprot:TRINITY_DN10968_c0_g1_i1.p1 TRINITY_DN10968_c0_g1~~TRINITY_DN10968_c0_g1_i1.p1  ORF type:complete len:615 (-),score=108.58 TRINITY_DN10968_c0_g1_i1:97-1881(-)